MPVGPPATGDPLDDGNLDAEVGPAIADTLTVDVSKLPGRTFQRKALTYVSLFRPLNHASPAGARRDPS